jgi:twitching motility protein PilJ
MQVLREISSQTSDSTTATSASIGKLAELAAQLRKSVTGFRLPEGAVTSTSGEYPAPRTGDSPAANGGERMRRVSGLSG